MIVGFYIVVVDCSFEFDMCNWRQVNVSKAPVRWERTSEQILHRYADSYRSKQIEPMLKEFWSELNTRYAGEHETFCHQSLVCIVYVSESVTIQ